MDGKGGEASQFKTTEQLLCQEWLALAGLMLPWAELAGILDLEIGVKA